MSELSDKEKWMNLSQMQETIISELKDQLAACQKELAEKDKKIARLKEELRYALDFDPDGMVSKIKRLETEIARLKTDDEILLEIISGIRPHFEKTGLSCLDDCDEAIDILRKRINL